MAIDWCEAARLLAAGLPTNEIAGRIGCSRSQLYRRRTGCALFRALVRAYEAGAPAGPEVDEAAPIEARVRRKLEAEIADGNLKVALWLAERLRLFAPESRDGAGDAIRQLMESMTPLERAAFSRAE